jgi:hypothetical protein
VCHKKITAKQYFCVSFKCGYINLDTTLKQPVTEETWWKKSKTTKYMTAEMVHMALFWPQWALNPLAPELFFKFLHTLYLKCE